MLKRPGFTLIELLVVVVIIGILATISIGAFNDAKDRARNASETSLVRGVQMGIEQWKTDFSGLPEELVGGTNLNNPAKVLCASDSASSSAWVVKYTPGAMMPKTPWSNTPQTDMDSSGFHNDLTVGSPGNGNTLFISIFNGGLIGAAMLAGNSGCWDDGGPIGGIGQPPPSGTGPNERRYFGYMYMMTDAGAGRYVLAGAGKKGKNGYLVSVKSNF